METDSKKYKDVRKITLGLCKKDLLNFKKNKKAHFIIVLRLLLEQCIKTHLKSTFENFQYG